jgi:hypothetical protein
MLTAGLMRRTDSVEIGPRRTCALGTRVTINSSSTLLNSAATLSSDGGLGDRGMGDKLSALAWIRVVDGRSQHIHDQL